MRRLFVSLAAVFASTCFAAPALAGRPVHRDARVRVVVQVERTDRHGGAHGSRHDRVDRVDHDDFEGGYGGYQDDYAEGYGDGYADASDDCDDDVRAPLIPLGATVDVQFGSAWWKALVMDERAGYYLVHYQGYAANWSEWVALDRIRPPFAVTPGQAPEIRNVFMNDAPLPFVPAWGQRTR